MGKIDYLKIAKEYSIKKWGFDIVLPAGEEDGWHYFSCTKEGRPHYSSMPMAIRVNRNGNSIEEVKGDALYKVNGIAYRMSLKSKN